MASCCRTCDHRNNAVKAWPTAPSQLDVCIVTLTFETPFISTATGSYFALNTLLNNIVDNEESTSRPSTFTAWSPCLNNPKTIVIITTFSEICTSSTASVFDVVRGFLAKPPNVQHVYFDLALLSLAASSPEQRIPCDIMQLHAPNPDVAVAMGKLFGWDPKRSSLSSQLQTCAPAAFSRPGDLIRDFWAWAELPYTSQRPSSVSTGSYETLSISPRLINTNSDEKNMSLLFPEEDDEPPPYTDDETLIMIFQWSSSADGERFKDSEQKSYGPNGEEVSKDFWDRQVAQPVSDLEQLGARAETFRLELRAVEPRLIRGGVIGRQERGTRERSGSKRLSMLTSGLGEKVSGLWR
jgi:hypothetical protein